MYLDTGEGRLISKLTVKNLKKLSIVEKTEEEGKGITTLWKKIYKRIISIMIFKYYSHDP